MEIPEITIKLMFDKVESLEKQVLGLQTEVSELKSRLSEFENGRTEQHATEPPDIMSMASPVTGKRDTTKYMWEGNVYLKNRLVLAIVRDYAKRHPDITRRQLKTIFDKTLQGSLGVVEDEEPAKLRSDYDKRFFAKPDEALTLADGNMYVCTQWGILNIPKFLARARELGYDIKEIRS